MRGATNASNIGGTVGSNHSPIKIVNGVPQAVDYSLVDTVNNQTINGYKTFTAPITINQNLGHWGTIFTEVDGTNRQVALSLTKQDNDYAGLYLRLQPDGTCVVFAVKFINGVSSSISIASF